MANAAPVPACLDKHSILPAAVEYLQNQSSEGLDDATLRKMLRECEDWFVWMDTVRRGLKSLAGRTEWDAMMRQETVAVIGAHDQLEAEAAIREASRPVVPERRRSASQGSTAGSRKADSTI